MPVFLAWLLVVLIWSTTPLAIKISSMGTGFAFAVLLRMLVGVVAIVPLLWLLRIPFPLHGRARQSYLAGGLGLFGTMVCVYWSAGFVTSGLISVLFGLSPLITGLFAVLWLGESLWRRERALGMALGVLGLVVIFHADLHLAQGGLPGVLGVLAGVGMQAASLVWVKRIADDSPPLATTLGILLVSLPLFLLVWLLTGAAVPQQPAPLAVGAIVYLGLAGSVAGFALYYYIIKHMETGKITLITLVTPVLSLLLGHWLNHEMVGLHVWLGAGLIGTGLLVHQWRDFAVLLRRVVGG